MAEHKIPYGVQIGILSRAFKRGMDERLRERGLTGPQMAVLGELRHLECSGVKEIHQKDLETAVGLTHPTMNDLLCRLEKKGYILREPSKQDRRAKVIRSAAPAEELHEAMPVMDAEVMAELTAGLSPAEVEEFFRVAELMLANAKRMREGKEECADD